MQRRTILLATAASGLGGCSLWPQAAADEPTLHLLDARAQVAAAAPRDIVLAVSAPRAAAGIDTPAMLYLRKGHAIEHYATHRWADTPARMLAPLLVRALEDTRAFRAVVAAGDGVPAALRLDTEIVQLRQSFLAGPSRAELTLRAQLIDAAARRVIATRYVEAAQPAASDDAPGGVAAANAATAAALAQLAAWCVEASAAVGARP
ncbi:MAG: ABC-type transport auxiliary lipoprotein family protein [Burkholderiaceae bacterium]